MALLLIVTWVVFIWSLSSQSYQQQTIQPWLHKWFQQKQIVFLLPDIQFTYGEYNYSLKQRPSDFVEFIFRKSAHMFVYSILAVLFYGSLGYLNIRGLIRVVTALVGVVVIASIDEYIQQFSQSRTSSIADVGIDFLGGCFGIFIYVVLHSLGRRIKKRRDHRRFKSN